MELMTIKDVCDFLNITRSTFYSYKKKGLPVRYMPDTDKPYIIKEELLAWMEGDCDERASSTV